MADGSYKAINFFGYDSSSSDEEQQWLDDLDKIEEVCIWVHVESSENRRHRGSIPGHKVLERDHTAGHARIMADYFVPNPVYTDYQFHRR